MKKTFIIALTLLAAFSSVEAKKTKKQKVDKTLTNAVDSMSYALGVSVGSDFSKNLEKIPGGQKNMDLIVKGFSSAMKNETTLMDKESATEYFRKYIAEAQDKDIQSKKAQGEKFLAENKKEKDVIETATGLQYKIITATEGPKPGAKDTVKVHYVGTLIDGTKFDSSVDRGEPIEFSLNEVIPGWTEGVQLMSKGSKYKFFLPSRLGYGEQGAGQFIPPHSALIFEIELLDFKPFKEIQSEKTIKDKKKENEEIEIQIQDKKKGKLVK